MPRRPAPWYRSQLDSWYARDLAGRQIPLGVRGRANEAAAWGAFARLRSGAPPTPEPPTTTQPPAITHPTAKPQPIDTPQVCCVDVFRAFLDDAAGRVRPDTLALYCLFLDGFAAKCGQTPATALTCPAA